MVSSKSVEAVTDMALAKNSRADEMLAQSPELGKLAQQYFVWWSLTQRGPRKVAPRKTAAQVQAADDLGHYLVGRIAVLLGREPKDIEIAFSGVLKSSEPPGCTPGLNSSVNGVISDDGAFVKSELLNSLVKVAAGVIGLKCPNAVFGRR